MSILRGHSAFVDIAAGNGISRGCAVFQGDAPWGYLPEMVDTHPLLWYSIKPQGGNLGGTLDFLQLLGNPSLSAASNVLRSNPPVQQMNQYVNGQVDAQTYYYLLEQRMQNMAVNASFGLRDLGVTEAVDPAVREKADELLSGGMWLAAIEMGDEI